MIDDIIVPLLELLSDLAAGRLVARIYRPHQKLVAGAFCDLDLGRMGSTLVVCHRDRRFSSRGRTVLHVPVDGQRMVRRAMANQRRSQVC
jgi:hypothetical protein